MFNIELILINNYIGSNNDTQKNSLLLVWQRTKA